MHSWRAESQRRGISWSPWRGFCGRWEVFRDLHYITDWLYNSRYNYFYHCIMYEFLENPEINWLAIPSASSTNSPNFFQYTYAREEPRANWQAYSSTSQQYALTQGKNFKTTGWLTLLLSANIYAHTREESKSIWLANSTSTNVGLHTSEEPKSNWLANSTFCQYNMHAVRTQSQLAG